MKQNYSELRNLLDKSEKEKNYYEKLKHEYSLTQEALTKSIDTSNKHDILIEAHNKSKADLTRMKSENENLKLEFNPISHGPLGPDRFSKSSFDHEIWHLPPRYI